MRNFLRICNFLTWHGYRYVASELQFDDCLWPRGQSWYHNRRALEAQVPEGNCAPHVQPACTPQSVKLGCNLTRPPSFTVSSSSECDDATEDDDQSFESCEQHRNSAASSPQIRAVELQVLPSPSSVAVTALARLSVESHDLLAAPADDSPKDQIDSESSSLVATLSLATADVDAVDASVSPNASSSPHADALTSDARAADATDGTDDGDQGQIFDCFDLKIVYERGRTGFEDTKEIDFTPGMLIAVRVLLLFCCSSLCVTSAAGSLSVHSIFGQRCVQQRAFLCRSCR